MSSFLCPFIWLEGSFVGQIMQAAVDRTQHKGLKANVIPKNVVVVRPLALRRPS